MAHRNLNPMAHHPDDIEIWPEGIWCYLGEVEEMRWKSDDYEVIRLEDIERLGALGILAQLCRPCRPRGERVTGAGLFRHLPQSDRKPVAGLEPAAGFLVPTGARMEVCSDRPSVPWRQEGLKDERHLQFRLRCAPTKSAPPLAGSAGRFALLDPSLPPSPRASSFTTSRRRRR